MKNITKAILATIITATTFTTASVMNIKPLQAQNSFSASGQWRCITANKDLVNKKYNGSFTIETIINAYPNGSFEAQGMTVINGGSYPLIAAGNWSVNQTPQGPELNFIGQQQDQLSGQSQFNVGGTLQNANYLTYQAASNINQVAVACERVG